MSFVIWGFQPVKIILLILSRVNRQVGRKREISKTRHLTTTNQMWPELGSNP